MDKQKEEVKTEQKETTRRDLLKKGAYVAPVVIGSLTLSGPSMAGSGGGGYGY